MRPAISQPSGAKHRLPGTDPVPPQNPNSAGSVDYLTHEYDRVKRLAEEVSGVTITDDDLRASIVVFNENRRLLRELYDIKRTTPWLVAAEDAYALVALAGMIPREEHNELLATLLPRSRNVASRRKIASGSCLRVAFANSLRLISSGCSEGPVTSLTTTC